MRGSPLSACWKTATGPNSCSSIPNVGRQPLPRRVGRRRAGPPRRRAGGLLRWQFLTGEEKISAFMEQRSQVKRRAARFVVSSELLRWHVGQAEDADLARLLKSSTYAPRFMRLPHAYEDRGRNLINRVAIDGLENAYAKLRPKFDHRYLAIYSHNPESRAEREATLLAALKFRRYAKPTPNMV